MEPTPPPPPLQFDVAVPQAAGPTAGQTGGVTCAACQQALAQEYYDVNGTTVCASCRDTVASHAQTPRGWGVFTRAALAGLTAAVLGAVLYYAVIALLAPISIVAIAIGFMVGYGIRMGTSGRGGRRFQILAVVLTYWAVGLAYTPIAYKAVSTPKTRQTTSGARRGEATVTTEIVTTEPEVTTVTAGEPVSTGNLAILLTFVLVLSFALPVMSVVGSLPAGLISAFVIAIGMRQAWQMTAAPTLQISGPYRIGAAGS